MSTQQVKHDRRDGWRPSVNCTCTSLPACCLHLAITPLAMIRPTSLSLRALTRHARLAAHPQTVIRPPVVLAARTIRAHSSASASAPKTSPMQPAAEAPGSFTPTPLATYVHSVLIPEKRGKGKERDLANE